jgi:phosphoribosyl 1,2-cyclic phosphodiesterase
MIVRCWGVRGSLPVSGPQFIMTGGNTTCFEVTFEGSRIILDGGTGIQALGAELGSPCDATLLFTHVHWDHIQGVPFFGPLHHPESRILLAGRRNAFGGLRDALAAQMKPPSFPVGLDIFQADMTFRDVNPDEPFEIGPFRITGSEMSHPDGILVYRIEAGGKSLVFATDVEHGSSLDPRLVHFAKGADLLLHDAQYSEDEYFGRSGPSRVGWGHATWNQAVQTGIDAGVGRLGLIHHDPMRTDDQVLDIEAWAKERLAQSFVAREGLTISV